MVEFFEVDITYMKPTYVGEHCFLILSFTFNKKLYHHINKLFQNFASNIKGISGNQLNSISQGTIQIPMAF